MTVLLSDLIAALNFANAANDTESEELSCKCLVIICDNARVPSSPLSVSSPWSSLPPLCRNRKETIDKPHRRKKKRGSRSRRYQQRLVSSTEISTLSLLHSEPRSNVSVKKNSYSDTAFHPRLNELLRRRSGNTSSPSKICRWDNRINSNLESPEFYLRSLNGSISNTKNVLSSPQSITRGRFCSSNSLPLSPFHDNCSPCSLRKPIRTTTSPLDDLSAHMISYSQSKNNASLMIESVVLSHALKPPQRNRNTMELINNSLLSLELITESELDDNSSLFIIDAFD